MTNSRSILLTLKLKSLMLSTEAQPYLTEYIALCHSM